MKTVYRAAQQQAEQEKAEDTESASTDGAAESSLDADEDDAEHDDAPRQHVPRPMDRWMNRASMSDELSTKIEAHLARGGRDGAAPAIGLARRAAEEEADNQQYRCGLGAVLMGAGRHDESKAELSHQRSPQCAAVALHPLSDATLSHGCHKDRGRKL